MIEFIRGRWTPLSTTSIPGVGEDGVEERGELAILVSDHELRPAILVERGEEAGAVFLQQGFHGFHC
jgi:hypothetical protein